MNADDALSDDSNVSIDDLPKEDQKQADKPRRLTKEESQAIASADELLTTLEHSHRCDLPLHLYSSFLLKKSLYRSNEKKHPYEIDQFIKRNIKDNWISWPNRDTIIDPQTDQIYEDINDIIDEHQPAHLKPGEVSERALKHATEMLNLELNAVWQRKMMESSKEAVVTLDINRMKIPTDVTFDVVHKLDHLMASLHYKVAAQNKFVVSKENGTTVNEEEDMVDQQSQLNITQDENVNNTVKLNKKIKLNYHDIIERGCEMNENMRDIYMKSLKLYNDIPNNFAKHNFKLPKKVLKRYRYTNNKKNKDKSYNVNELYDGLKDDYISFDKLLNDDKLSLEDKFKLRILNKKQNEIISSKKTFLQVKGNNEETEIGNTINSIKHISNPEDRQNRWLDEISPYIEENDELDDDNYGISDCLAALPK